MVCPRFVHLGLALLVSGCATLDRLGDTKLTDGVAPVFDPEVPYFPSTDEAVLGMLRLAETGPKDVVYDLGCGDGRIVIAAARDFGARGVGVEIDPGPLEADIGEATVVTLFLFETLNRRLLPKLLRELAPGTRIVAHRYGFGDAWPPERTVRAGASTLYLWTVPKR